MEQKTEKIRIKDIAEKSGFSIGTVDRVLHNRGEVNEKTREKVMQIIQEMQYSPNLMARSLAAKSAYRFVSVIPDSTDNNPYWRRPKEGVLKAAEEIKDFLVEVETLHFNATDPISFSKACNEALEMAPNGVILNPVFHEESQQFTAQLDAAGIPYVYIDTNLDQGNSLGYFGQDALQSGKVAASLMCKALPKNSTVLVLKLANAGVFSHHLQKRAVGFTEYYKKETGCACNIVNVGIDLLDKGEPSKTLGELLEQHPTVNGIFVPNSRVYRVAEYIERRAESKPLLIGYDLLEENVEFLRKGTIDYLISQKPIQQGYNSLMTLFNRVVKKQDSQLGQFTPIDIIMRENIDHYS